MISYFPQFYHFLFCICCIVIVKRYLESLFIFVCCIFVFRSIKKLLSLWRILKSILICLRTGRLLLPLSLASLRKGTSFGSIGIFAMLSFHHDTVFLVFSFSVISFMSLTFPLGVHMILPEWWQSPWTSHNYVHLCHGSFNQFTAEIKDKEITVCTRIYLRLLYWRRLGDSMAEFPGVAII